MWYGVSIPLNFFNGPFQPLRSIYCELFSFWAVNEVWGRRRQGKQVLGWTWAWTPKEHRDTRWLIPQKGGVRASASRLNGKGFMRGLTATVWIGNVFLRLGPRWWCFGEKAWTLGGGAWLGKRIIGAWLEYIRNLVHLNTQILSSLYLLLLPTPLTLLRCRRWASILYYFLCRNVLLLQHRSQNKGAQQARTKVSEARSQNKAFFF